MSGFKPTKGQLQILEQLKEVTEPYYIYTDQMMAIAMWIDAEFKHKSKANGENKEQNKALPLHGISGCSLETIEKLADCNVSQNHTGKWGVIFGTLSRTYSFMDKDKNKVLEWIRQNCR